MSLAVQLHNAIDAHNVLQTPTEQIGEYLSAHSEIYKIVLLANHLFRAAAMTALTLCIPWPSLVAHGICFLGSLFYRLTVETHCAYRLPVPAFGGSAAFIFAYTSGVDLMCHDITLTACAYGLLSLALLAAYVAYIVLTVSYDVDSRG